VLGSSNKSKEANFAKWASGGENIRNLIRKYQIKLGVQLSGRVLA
jgi:hypothetical protein